MNTVGTIIGGLAVTGFFFGGVLKLGRWSVRHKITELKEIKELLLDQIDDHEEIIFDIDSKIEELEDYGKKSICGKSKEN
tara:strand:+ start:1403 stop:1642 length:240 start_codon:yes stop_codon:yes gene_type:complete